MDDAERAVELVREADKLLAEFARPGRWPQARTVRRFNEAEPLETVLALYSTAMRLDPNELAYPWNLASSLHRLGHSEIALSFIERAVTLAHETGDEDSAARAPTWHGGTWRPRPVTTTPRSSRSRGPTLSLASLSL